MAKTKIENDFRSSYTGGSYTHTPDGVNLGGYCVYKGDISTRDGVIVNGFLDGLRRLFPFIPSGFRHYIIVSIADNDGRPVRTVVGTLKTALRVAKELNNQDFPESEFPLLEE